MNSNLQNPFSSPTGVTGTGDNLSPIQGDENQQREPHTITGGPHPGAVPQNNHVFSFQHDGTGGPSQTPENPDMWFLQEQERLQNEYRRRKAEHKHVITRTLSFGSTEPDDRLRGPRETRRPIRRSSLNNRAGAPPTGTGHSPEYESDDADTTYSPAYTTSHHSSRLAPTYSYQAEPRIAETIPQADDLSAPYKPKRLTEKSKFSARIALATLSSKSKLPTTVGKYDGLSDPDDHIMSFTTAGRVCAWSLPTWCHLFA